MTPAERFLAELLETYEPEEVPEIIAMLQRAEVALRGYPLDVDMTDVLTMRSLGDVMGWLPLPDEIPGITDRVPGAFDMPLSQLRKHMSPAQFREHVRVWGVAEDAKHQKFCAAVAARYSFPDP